MKNMEIWDKVSRPPKEALKTIGGGRLKGMTDINPQWRFKIMTETFGPIGMSWKYSIEKLWTEPGADGVVLAFAQINLYTGTTGGDKNPWSDPIPGIGGSTMIAKEKDGLYSNDEAYKMAVTDALSVAMKSLGVAADIYAGLWDGSKYRDAPVAQGIHKPSDGAMERLSTDMQTVVRDTAEEVKVKMAGGKIADALDWLEAANFDADAKVACWDLLPSQYRTAITKFRNEKKEL